VYVQTGLKKGLLVFSPHGHVLRQLSGLPSPTGDCGPWGIAVGPDRRVYAADCATIWVYGRSSDRPTPWYSPQRGPSALSAAWTIVFDRSGAAYISDFDNNRIIKVSRAGKFLGALATGKVVGPWGLAIDRTKNLIVVEHRADSLAQVAPNGTILKRIDLSGHASPLSPTDVAIGSAGTIFVNARDDDQILRFSSAGKFLGVFVHPGKRAGTVMHPMGIATDQLGNLYVSDSGNNRIKKFSPSGTLIAVWTP
jgi:sugar lactone lactonase YvrE